jgi:hypothetical protein
MRALFWSEKLKIKKSLGRRKIRMNVKETAWEGIDWMDMVQDMG